jgi:PAS domain S-box-containing protein
MTLVVPESTATEKTAELFPDLSDLLESALEFIGAAAGWIGLQDGDGVTFPVRRGVFSDSWLRLQARGSVWGFAVGGEPALINDLQPWLALGDPPLRNLLSCPLIRDARIVGHIALANKAQGFAAHDAAVLQGLAHHLVRLLGRRPPQPRTPIALSPPWRRLLDAAADGVVMLDESGVLVFANAAWLDWTGFRAEELLGRSPPFPFWISQQDLVRAASEAAAAPAQALPFRRRDQTLFWCQVETSVERWNDRAVTVAFLQQRRAGNVSDRSLSPAADVPGSPLLEYSTPNWLPLLLNRDGGIEGWNALWEERTGLCGRDVQGSRTELVLDWLFPQQPDRDRVADCFHHPQPSGHQLLLDLAAPNGSQAALCTLLPLPGESSAPSSRWLLLVGEPAPAASAKSMIRVDAPEPAPGPHPSGEPSRGPERAEG